VVVRLPRGRIGWPDAAAGSLPHAVRFPWSAAVHSIRGRHVERRTNSSPAPTEHIAQTAGAEHAAARRAPCAARTSTPPFNTAFCGSRYLFYAAGSTHQSRFAASGLLPDQDFLLLRAHIAWDDVLNRFSPAPSAGVVRRCRTPPFTPRLPRLRFHATATVAHAARAHRFWMPAAGWTRTAAHSARARDARLPALSPRSVLDGWTDR